MSIDKSTETSLNNLFDQNKFYCNKCDRTFKSKRALTSHKNFHDPEYQQKIKNGQNLEKTSKSQKLRNKKVRNIKKMNIL